MRLASIEIRTFTISLKFVFYKRKTNYYEQIKNIIILNSWKIYELLNQILEQLTVKIGAN